MTQRVVANCAKDERQENLRPQLPAAQQDKTAGRAKLPHQLCDIILKGWGQSIEGYECTQLLLVHLWWVFICWDRSSATKTTVNRTMPNQFGRTSTPLMHKWCSNSHVYRSIYVNPNTVIVMFSG
jgi:ribosomal protein L32